MIEVLHGFEPYADGLTNRDIVVRYRQHELEPRRVTRRETLGTGCVMREPISAARVRPGQTTVATVPASELLDRLSASMKPRDLAEAAFTRSIRLLCQDAITALGPDASILHAIHGAPAGVFDLKDLA